MQCFCHVAFLALSGVAGARGANRSGSRGSARGAAGRRSSGGQPAVLKFDDEFDFEIENAKFDKEEIEREFKQKLNISEWFTAFFYYTRYYFFSIKINRFFFENIQFE